MLKSSIVTFFFAFTLFFTFGQRVALDRFEAVQMDQSIQFILPQELHKQDWSLESQPLFWKKIMCLSPDSMLVNFASNRQIVERIAVKRWSVKTEEEKQLYRDSVRMAYGVDSTARIFFTTGKNNFYRFDLVMQQLTRGIELFEDYGTDPWYAQAILLIESPGQMRKSTAGAYGPFQLMPGVARSQGLTVNKSVDERTDFDRSAYGASRLINRICIPEARRILNAKNIAFNENDLWFRLFVMHVYHAGAGNVAAVVNAIEPTIGGKELILKMWQTSAANFGNNSQNYTQLALAATLILEELIQAKYAQVFTCWDAEKMN